MDPHWTWKSQACLQQVMAMKFQKWLLWTVKWLVVGVMGHLIFVQECVSLMKMKILSSILMSYLKSLSPITGIYENPVLEWFFFFFKETLINVSPPFVFFFFMCACAFLPIKFAFMIVSRFEVTGVTEENLKDAMPLKLVQEKVQEILFNGESIWKIRLEGGRARILVGHNLEHDLCCLRLNYPDHLIR